MTGAPRENAAHFEWIDILRGLSAFAVVIFHARIFTWVGWNAIRGNPGEYGAFDKAVAWLSIPTPFFGSAVMLFFLISGFCVHLPHAAGGRPLALGTYARRRFWRIYPPYLAAVLFTLAVEAILAMRGVKPSALATIMDSVFMVQNYGADATQLKSNGSLWSLPVEMELYVAYPVFAWLLVRFGLKKSMAVAGAVSAGMLALAVVRNWDKSFFHPALSFSFFWIIWCTGAAAAEVLRRGTLPSWKPWMAVATGLAFMAGVACTSIKRLPHEFAFFAWAAFYAGIMVYCLNRPCTLSPRVKKPLMFLGTISYSLYLLHWPILALAGNLWEGAFGSKPANFLVCLLFSLLMIPFAWIFYRAVELPSHKMARGKRARTLETTPEAVQVAT